MSSRSLLLVATEVLAPAAPVDFDLTFHKPDHYASDDSRWEPGLRRQALWWRGRPVGLVMRNRGSVSSPAIEIAVYASGRLSPDYLTSLLGEIRYRFNLELDLGPFYARCGDDPTLGPILERRRGLRPGHPNSLYEYLVVGITLQNTVVRRSIQMMRALFKAHGHRLAFSGADFWCFWAPGALAAVPEQDLRALKVGYRARSLLRLDAEFAGGRIDEAALRCRDLDAQRRALLGLHGVGPATAGYLLTDVFHQWDHLDHISPWEQKIVSRLLLGTDPQTPAPVPALLARLATYRPFRALALHYLWEDLWWRRESGEERWLDALIRT